MVAADVQLGEIMIEKIEADSDTEMFNCVHTPKTLDPDTGFPDCDNECVRWNDDKETFVYCPMLQFKGIIITVTP